jgi:hypothetical protein
MFNDLLQLFFALGINLPPEFSTFFRALVTLEGTLITLSPGHLVIVARASLAPASLEDLARHELGSLALLRGPGRAGRPGRAAVGHAPSAPRAARTSPGDTSLFRFFGYFGLFCATVLILRVIVAILRGGLNSRRRPAALGTLKAGHAAAEQEVADLLGAAPGVGPDLVAGEAEDGVALGDQVAVAAALAHDLVGAGPDRPLAVDLDHHPGQDQEVDPVGADLAVGLDQGALGGVREPGGQPHPGQGPLDPAEQAAGRRVGLGQQLDHGDAEGGPHRLRPSWCVVAASGDTSLHWHSPARPVRA